MRTLLPNLLKAAAVGCAVAGLAIQGGQAAAQSPKPHFMKLGDPAPAPLGYLNFCARTPEQCGLDAAVNLQGRTAEQRAQELKAKYYWPMVFGADQPTDVALTPTSGVTARSFGGRYDWNAIFGVSSSAPNTVQPLATDRALMAELERVNVQINRSIRYVPDSTLYGDEDHWHLPLQAGGLGAGDCKDFVLEKRRALIADGVPAADLSIAIVQTSWNETHAVLLVTTDQGEVVLDSLNSWVRPWQDVHYRWIERQAPGQQLNWVKLSQGI